MRSTVRAGTLVLALVCVLCPMARATSLRTGRDAARPAIAYQAGGGALKRQPARAPVPCLAVIDQRSSESADVNVLRSGRVLYAPLVENDFQAPLDDRGPAEIAASDTGGRTWTAVLPGDANHPAGAYPKNAFFSALIPFLRKAAAAR